MFDSVALEPCTVDLVQEEEKLMNLQLELEALSAELKPVRTYVTHLPDCHWVYV